MQVECLILKALSIIYRNQFLSRLLVASKDMEAELVCVDSYGKKAGMGVLDGGGFLFTVPLHTVRKLLNPDCALLKTLGIDCIYFYIYAPFHFFSPRLI